MRKLVLAAAVILLCCVGCGKKEVSSINENEANENETSEDKTSENEINENAEKVIKAMMTCPNSELFSLDAMEPIGEGAEGVQVSAEKERKEVKENWEKEVGDCFAEESFESFLEQGADFYLSRSEAEGTAISVENMTLKENAENSQSIQVELNMGEKTEEVTVVFTYAPDGRIRKVEWQK